MLVGKKGSVNWRSVPNGDSVQADEFVYVGRQLPADRLAWDPLLENIREKTQVELDADQVLVDDVTAGRSDFLTQFATALTKLDAIIAQAGTRTNAQAQDAITDLARIVKRHLKYTKAG